MMKTLTALFLLSCICAGNEFEEYEFVEPPPPSPYARFAKTGPALVNGQRVTATWYQAWAECPVAMLEEPIPQEALDYVYGVSTDEEGVTTPNKTNLKLRDFTLRSWVSLDGTKAIVLLGAREFDIGRMMPVGLEQIQMWAQYLSAYGYTPDKWMIQVEAMEKIHGAEYSEGVQ